MLNLNNIKMKKITLSLMIIVLSLTTIPTVAFANNNNLATSKSATSEVPVEIQVMYDRLEEIKEMDKSELKSSERKALRKEVRAIKSELRSTNNGVYLSIGAIIIIILLLILIL